LLLIIYQKYTKKHFPFLIREARGFLPEPLWDLPIGHGFMVTFRSDDSENLYIYVQLYTIIIAFTILMLWHPLSERLLPELSCMLHGRITEQ